MRRRVRGREYLEVGVEGHDRREGRSACLRECARGGGGC